jgi:hypothetical protein
MDEVVGGCILRDNSVPSGKERGRWPSTSCGVNDDHYNKFGRPPTAVSSRESPPPPWRSELKGGVMRYHGVDLHKGSAAVSIRDEVGHEVRYLAKVETASYVATLGPQDSVALESCAGTFWWAERIQRRGARCVVIDPYRFRIIRDSWHKTDRHDAGAHGHHSRFRLDGHHSSRCSCPLGGCMERCTQPGNSM